LSRTASSVGTLDRALALDLVRVTEAAAIGAATLVGRGDKEAADQAAVDAMRSVLDTVQIDGVVVIGEGEKDEAPMLYNGEQVGSGGQQADIAVDPLEGTTLAAHAMPNALAVFAVAPRGTMFNPGPVTYMEKIAGGRDIADLLDLDRPLEETVKLVAERRGVDASEVTVVILDRPRHEEQVKAVRAAGGRVRLIPHGDVSASLLAVTEGSGVDLLWGIGGTPEGVISAVALKCIGGRLLGRLYPRTDEERTGALEAGYDLGRILSGDDLVTSEDCFFAATGVTDGDVLRGVRFTAEGGATTESLSLRASSHSVRRVDARHNADKVGQIIDSLSAPGV
jgi:fructose-1,6-bisphosphatase II